MNLSKFNNSSFLMKLFALLVVAIIINCLGVFKKWKKSKLWVKSFFILILFLLFYIMFHIPNYKENFGNPSSCTYYYMTNCGHCKRFTPEWDSFAQSYNGPIKLKKLEMNDAGSDLEKYNIKGFPTVLLVDEQGETKEYDGPRTSDGLNNFFLSLGN
jgi:thiol-disulfide isomerase/thioredoxin